MIAGRRLQLAAERSGVTALVLRTGRTIILHGIVLLTVFVVYLFTTVVP